MLAEDAGWHSQSVEMPFVLIVEDDVPIHDMLRTVLQATGYVVSFASDGEEALRRYKTEEFDLVLTDIRMEKMDGIALLRQLKLYDPTVVVIIMTSYATLETAVQALKYGAFDYLQKPFPVPDLVDSLRRGLEFRKFQVQRPPVGTAAEGSTPEIERRIIGRSVLMTKLIAHLKKLTALRAPLLLIGENGTGKSLVAEVLHGASGATNANFVRIDCSLCPEASFREGLLGQNGQGGAWVTQAKGGTLLLQHLQCLSKPVQKELVSVLRNSAHGFRLVCTTSEDLEKLVEEGKFYDELFYRVASLPIRMPALRERAEDIPLLVKTGLSRAANPHFNANVIEFAAEAMAAMTAYRWPGNLTELFQVVSTIGATTETRIVTLPQLPLRLREPTHLPARL